MLTIMATGNYNFFNLLFIALCVSLMDDDWLVFKVKQISCPIGMQDLNCKVEFENVQMFGWTGYPNAITLRYDCRPLKHGDSCSLAIRENSTICKCIDRLTHTLG